MSKTKQGKRDRQRKAVNCREDHSLESKAQSSSKMVATKLSPHRLWIFRAVSIVAPFALLLLANLVCYLLGVGADTSLVVRASAAGPNRFIFNPRADFAYVSTDLRGPEARGFDLPKPSEVFRVVVVGESSVQGYPFPSELAFPRQMQLLLERQLKNRRVEVLNAGIIGVSSIPLVDIVRQVVDAQPDIIVFYAGHNEFYGAGGVSTNAPVNSVSIAARRFRIVQAATGLFSGSWWEAGDLISKMPKQLEIPLDSPLFKSGEKQFETCLRAICKICGDSDIPLIVCNPVSNLRDQSPLLSSSATSSHSSSSQSIVMEWLSRSAIEELPAEDLGITEARCRGAIAQNSASAILHYRLARILERENRGAEANIEYVMARDLDVCRYRAPSSFRQIARQVAQENSGRGVHFLDLKPVFDEATKFAAPGEDLFLEHVHFTLEGHWLMARTIAHSIVQDVMPETEGVRWNDGSVPTEQERDEWLGLLAEDQLVAHTIAHNLSLSSPYDKAVDAEWFRTQSDAKLIQMEKDLAPFQVARFSVLNDKAKLDDLVDSLGRAELDRGDPFKALKLFEIGARRRTWMPNSLVFSAVSLEQLGRKSEAKKAIQASWQTTLPATKPIEELRMKMLKRL